MAVKEKDYEKKRDFNKTPEPKSSGRHKAGKLPLFVVQKHDARRLHYDFRIEVNGTLKSWAVPKGPSTDPDVRCMAIPTEDHPMEYVDFEGVIPKGNYGAGTVMVWDTGTYQNIKKDDEGKLIPVEKCYKMGTIEIELKGKKMKGGWTLVKMKSGEMEGNWLLIKMKDNAADPDKDLVEEMAKSAKTNRTIEEIGKQAK